jgi:hypothetical protein
MQIKLPHTFSKSIAVQKVKVALEKARPELVGKATIDEERWDGDTLNFAFTAEGQHISGTCTVTDHEFDIYAKLPFMLRLFEGKIQKAIEEQAKLMIK